MGAAATQGQAQPSRWAWVESRLAPRRITLNDKELARLWKAIDSPEFGATEPMRIILKIAALTGQRNNEVAGTSKASPSLMVLISRVGLFRPGG